MMPCKYRWLIEGEWYRYGPKEGKGDDTRRLQTVRVITLPYPGTKPANVLVEFENGYQAIVPSGVLRRAP